MIRFSCSPSAAFYELFDGFPLQAYKTTHTDTPDLAGVDQFPRLRPPAAKDVGEILDRKQTFFETGFIHGFYPFAVAVVSVEHHLPEGKPHAPSSPTSF
jgi:hypothetical protein